jgi:hypothetical protein
VLISRRPILFKIKELAPIPLHRSEVLDRAMRR